jgi:hypothetical protein
MRATIGPQEAFWLLDRVGMGVMETIPSVD